MSPIEVLYAERYGCLQNVSVHLTPLHAFIGPNDSGKSTILRAVRTAVQLAIGGFASGPAPSWVPFDPAISRDDTPYLSLALTRRPSDPGRYRYHVRKLKEGDFELGEIITGTREIKAGRTMYDLKGLVQTRQDPGAVAIREQLEGEARLLRLDPDALRQSSGLIVEGQELDYLDDRGLGLPGVYDAIQNRGDGSFDRIAEDVRRLFPTIKNLRLRNVSANEKVLETKLNDGTLVPASLMSEGLLFYLAFAAIPHLVGTSVLLVEEPENGLHPARIRDVVRVLREISKRTQVLIATHSPLVINELEPEEVTVTTRHPEEGTRATPLKETPSFEERAKVYALGELWLAYANGDDEAPLLGENTG
jgi:predicted ATPase